VKLYTLDTDEGRRCTQAYQSTIEDAASSLPRTSKHVANQFANKVVL